MAALLEVAAKHQIEMILPSPVLARVWRDGKARPCWLDRCGIRGYSKRRYSMKTQSWPVMELIAVWLALPWIVMVVQAQRRAFTR
jgi:hypothetical protein